MEKQTALSDKLKKHSSHHTFIPDWIHDCVEWGDCDILIEKIEQKNKYRMKVRLAKKIIKPSFRNGKIGYWHSRYDLYCMGFDGCRDHRITKAEKITARYPRKLMNCLARLAGKTPFEIGDIISNANKIKSCGV